MSIRDLTKSALSFSWALSLLGAKQAVNLIQPRRENGSNVFAPIAQVAADQLDESVKGLFQSGDSLQASAIDMAFKWMNPVNWFSPNTWVRPFTGGSQSGAASEQSDCGCDQEAGNGFTRTAAGIGNFVSQAAAGVTSAIGQATAGIAQGVTGFTPSSQRTTAPRASTANTTPDTGSAASGWGPMPVDS